MQIHLKDKLNAFNLNTFSDRTLGWQYFILGFFIVMACFYGLSSYAILDFHEGVYAEVAREMLSGPHFIIPHLNNMPYVENPPLFYWFLALGYHIFGINAFGARIIPSLFFALTGLYIFNAGKRVGKDRTGFLAAIILFSSLIFSIIGRMVSFDIMLTFLTSVSLFSFYFWSQEKKVRDLYLSTIFLGLAILTNGFSSLIILPGIMLIFLLLIKADKETFKACLNKKAGIILLIIVLPWYVIAIFSLPQFFWEYFIHSPVLNFFHSGNRESIMHYFLQAVLYLLPWILFLPALLWPLHLKKPRQPLKVFLWTWFLVMLLADSLCETPNNYSVVIGMVPLAYLIAQKIEYWLVEFKSIWLKTGFYIFTGGLIFAGLIGLIFYRSTKANYDNYFSEDKIPFILNNSMVILTIGIIIYGCMGFLLLRKNPRQPMLPFLLTAGLFFPLILTYLIFMEKLQPMYSQISLANYVFAQYQHREVYFFEDFEPLSSFIFYNHEPIKMIESKSLDLSFGSRLKNNVKSFISLPDFRETAKKQSVYLVMQASQLQAFQQAMGETFQNNFCTVQTNGRSILLSNASDDCIALVSLQEGDQKETDLRNLKNINDQKMKKLAKVV